MSWPNRRLEEICSFKTGKLDSNAAVPAGAYPFFTCAQETYRIDTVAFDTEAVLLGGNNAAGVYPLKYYMGEFNAYQRTYVIETLNANILKTRFLYYSLSQALKRFQAASIGAATQYLTKSILNNFVISLPPATIQEKIVKIVSSYDDLIENNRRRIAHLEDAARMLYREWFVHFRFPGHEHVKIIDGLPEGWERRALGKIALLRKGKSITKGTVECGDVPVVAGGLKPAYYHNQWNAEGPVITVSASGANAGHVALYHTNIWASDCSFLSSSENARIWTLYLGLNARQAEITGMQQGAAQPHVYPKQLERLMLPVAPDSLGNLFEESVDASFRLISNLERQNDALAQARDLLLPRLMNGEIAV